MANLLIKPTTGPGNKLIIQDQDGGDILTSADSGATIANVTLSGDVLPSSDATQDLGSATKRWDNIFTTDLHLANDRGNWTVIEEENYLTLRNNKTDKVYKLVMEEIE